MTKIKTYSVKNPVIDSDKWIGSNGESGETKNFTAQDVADYVKTQLTPVDGGVLAVTEIDIDTLTTDISTTVNTMSPSYDVAPYELVHFVVEGRVYILKVVDATIGVGGIELSNTDFIILPVNTGPQGDAGATGADGADGTNGTNGTNGLNAVMTRTSTTSVAIPFYGVATFSFASTSNLGWITGMKLRAFNSTGNYIEGYISSPPTSTSVSIAVENFEGSGTFTSWNIGVAGDKGATGTSGVVITENTSGSLTITSQSLANLDYDLSFQDSGDKIFLSGVITNNTGSLVTAGQNIFTIIDSGYVGNTMFFSTTTHTISSTTASFMTLVSDLFSTITDIPIDGAIWINVFYYKA